MAHTPQRAARKSIDWGGEKRVNLALQGGGSHGAFTWGVLDHILEDGRLDIEAITGTSAGAMNAVALVHGYMDGGREGARKALTEFWSSIGAAASLSPIQRDLMDRLFSAWSFENSPLRAWFDLWSQFASPYATNPLDINPLRDHLAATIDFAKVRACEHIKLFIAATNVESGHIAIFPHETLTADHVMASACLPTVFQAVTIDGAAYWDGGYMGNPALFPLFYNTASPDIVIVQVNPIARAGVPRTPQDIQNRLNEITFNGALMGELRAIDFVNRLVDAGKLSPETYKRPFVHRIAGAAAIDAFAADTKFDTRWSFLMQLRDIGRDAAKRWLDENYAAIGERGTLDLRMAYD